MNAQPIHHLNWNRFQNEQPNLPISIYAKFFSELGVIAATVLVILKGRCRSVGAFAKNHPRLLALTAVAIYILILLRFGLVLLRCLIKIGADRELAFFQKYYALFCYEGVGGSKDFVQARTYLKKAAHWGNANAQYYYALMCQRGEGGLQDPHEAQTYFQRAADQGHVEAIRCLAALSSNALQISINPPAA